jgi:nucleoside-triphosphatase THEP1
MTDSNKYVTLTAEGDRGSGKSTVLQVASDALREAGYLVGPIITWGDEVIAEEMIVTTALETKEIKWLKK